MEVILYKVVVKGIVYLVDPATSAAYTYDLGFPTKIGTIVWTCPNEEPAIEFLDDYMVVLQDKLDRLTTGLTHIG
jgi:hypothetical protein